MLNKIFLSLILLLFANSIFGQNKTLCPPSSNKKAVKYYENALDDKKSRAPYLKIKESISKLIEEDSTFGDAYKLLGDVAYAAHKDDEMAQAYRKFIELCPDASSDVYYRLGNYYYSIKDFKNAIETLQSFLDFNKVKEENGKDASQKIAKARIMMNPVPFNPVPLPNVSSADPEYLAIISPDQDLCFFTRRYEESKKGTLFNSNVEKFMISTKVNGVFTKGEPMQPPFNKALNGNEGGATISIDNKYLYFTVNKAGNFDIYTSEYVNGKWTEPVSVGPEINDPKLWDSQPSISPDGKTLYFATFRDSINQTSDIYYSKKNPTTGKWNKAVPLPSTINTLGNEKTPFMHPDNKTFYFSSDQLDGLGGYDIYMSKLKEDGTWSNPVNIGYPINTEANELGFFVSTNGKKGYFASDNLKGVGGFDIYEFDLPEKVRPEKVLFIKGEVEGEKAALSSAKVELKSTKKKEIVEVNYDTITGKYASVVAFEDDFILTVKKSGYAYNSAYFSAEDTTLSNPQKVNLELKQSVVGSAYKLNNILYETSSAELNKQDKNIISDFADYLMVNPTIKVSIQGHTDSEGNDIDNLKLSEERAKSVYVYLTSIGINKARLTYKGFGETKPIADNTSETGRKLNRRTEFVILSK